MWVAEPANWRLLLEGYSDVMSAVDKTPQQSQLTSACYAFTGSTKGPIELFPYMVIARTLSATVSFSTNGSLRFHEILIQTLHANSTQEVLAGRIPRSPHGTPLSLSQGAVVALFPV